MPLRPTSPAGAPEGALPLFLAQVDHRLGRLRLAGRLDRGTCHVLLDVVRALVLDGGEHWTVDVTDLLVADHAGLRAIGSAYRRLVRRGVRMTFTGAPPALVGALTHLRLDAHLLDRTAAPAIA
ncbi:STAS domain-containing protein [Geodermatophilus sp. SYSU D00815]